MKNRVQGWIYAGPGAVREEADFAKDNGGLPLNDELHGTAVISKIIGTKTGIAPDTDLVVVKDMSSGGVIETLTHLDALVKIIDHIEQFNHHRWGIVVNLSSSSRIPRSNGHRPTKTQRFREYYFQKVLVSLYQELLSRDNVIIVTCAGNQPYVRSIYITSANAPMTPSFSPS